MAIADDYAETAKRFAAVAQRYCAIVDGAAQFEKREFLVLLHVVLAELIDEGVRLPLVNRWRPDAPQPPNEDLSKADALPCIEHQDRFKLYESLKHKLGETDSYSTVFNPATDKEAIRASLSDDIADIYRDMKEGLLLVGRSAGDAEEAVWDWQLGFSCHWGHHAICALQTIHHILHY